MTTTLDPREAADFDIVGAVREATTSSGTSKRRINTGFSLTHGKPAETAISVIFGLYLAYAVGRLPEVFPVFDQIPHLPMYMMLVFLALLVFTVPKTTWSTIWQRSLAFRQVTWLGVLGIGTAPLGVWMSGSIYYFRTSYAIALAVFVCCMVFLRDRRNLRRAIAIYVLCVGGVAAQTLVTTYAAPPPTIVRDNYDNLIDYNRAVTESSRITVGVSLDPNDFGAILAATFPLALWLGFGSLRRRIFWSGIALLLVAAVVPTASRGAMLAFGAVATVLIGVGARGWRRALTVILVAIGVLVFLSQANSGQLDRFTEFGASDYNLTSTQGRWHFWKQGFVWMLKRPLGYGIDNYPTYFEYVNGQGRAAHSLWVQYGMELGVAGIVLFIALCAMLIKRLIELRRRAVALGAREPDAKQEEALAGHAIAMLAGLMVAATFLSVAYSAMTYMCLGLAAATLLGSPLPSDTPVPRAPEVSPTVPARRSNRRQTSAISRVR